MRDLTHTEGIPHYVRIRESLRTRILNGEYQSGQKLPSEDELATQFSVSRMTVRQGVSDLIDEGLLYRRHGIGTFVAYPHVERDHTRLTNFFESSIEEGINAKACILDLEIITAKDRVARALAIAEGDAVIRIRTLRFADEVPVTVHDAHIPYSLFAKLLDEDRETLESEHLWTFMENMGYRVKSAIQHLQARDADEELARLMVIEEGAPILYKERTVYADDGTPVEFTFCYNRGDRYSLTVTLFR